VEVQFDGFPACEPGSRSLCLAAAQEHDTDALRAALQAADVPFHEPFSAVLCFELTPESLRKASAWWSVLDRRELESIRCLLSDQREVPTVARLMQSQRLSSLLAWMNGQWLLDVLRSNRLMTYFQPIVSASDPNQVFAYECLLRGQTREGGVISPYRLFTAARDTGLLKSLDAAARLTAIACFQSSHAPAETNVFINVNPRSLDDPCRNLHAAVQAILASGLAPERFVFELVESDQVTDFDNLLQILDFCREAGCRVALDDLGAGYNSLNLLAVMKPDFVKLDMDLIRDVDQDAYKGRVAGKLLELAKELQVKTVAEGVETAGEWQWVVHHGADYAQGYFFAKPAAVPPQPEVQVPSRAVHAAEFGVSDSDAEVVAVGTDLGSKRRDMKGSDK